MPEVTSSHESSPDSCCELRDILRDAIERTLQDADAIENLIRSGYLKATRNAWLRSLREAFSSHYNVCDNTGNIAVFGGRPRDPATRKYGAPTGIKEWRRRWEFQYDVSVLEVKRKPAPFNVQIGIPIITNAIWLVESEIASDGMQVGEDASKLRISKSVNKLLIAAQTTKLDPRCWLRFLGNAMANLDGNVFIALLPSYASGTQGAQCWIEGKVEMELYRCRQDNGIPDRVCGTLESAVPG